MVKITNLLTIKCKCGYAFSAQDVKAPLLTMQAALGYFQKGFYGGNIQRFSKAQCLCGRTYVLYLKQIRQGWQVKDMALLSDVPNAGVNMESEIGNVVESQEIAGAKDQVMMDDNAGDNFETAASFIEEVKSKRAPELKEMCVEKGIPVSPVLQKREVYLEKLINQMFGTPKKA